MLYHLTVLSNNRALPTVRKTRPCHRPVCGLLPFRIIIISELGTIQSKTISPVITVIIAFVVIVIVVSNNV